MSMLKIRDFFRTRNSAGVPQHSANPARDILRPRPLRPLCCCLQMAPWRPPHSARSAAPCCPPSGLVPTQPAPRHSAHALTLPPGVSLIRRSPLTARVFYHRPFYVSAPLPETRRGRRHGRRARSRSCPDPRWTACPRAEGHAQSGWPPGLPG